MEASGDVFDVIVVGGGIMGSCAAYHLARRGRSVLLLEQFDFLHHRGSSHGESRTIRATYPEPYYTAMVLEAFRLWEEAEAEAGYRVVTRTPHLDVGPAGDRCLLLGVENCRALSVPVRVLTPAEVGEMFSGAFELPEDWIGVLSEFGGVIRATKAVAMFQALAVRRGATLRDRMEVVEIKREGANGGIGVSTEGGHRFWGRKCVVTAGAWTRKLVEAMTRRVLPIQPLHTTICYWKIREGHEGALSPEGGFPTFISYGDPFIYGTPELEFPGLIKIALHEGYPCDPDRRTWEADLGVQGRTVAPWIERVMPGRVDPGRPAAVQACMYSMTPDGDFIIDFAGGELGEDVVVAGGFSGHGFKMGPVVADLVVEGVVAGVEMEWFRMKRFEAKSRGNAKEFEDQPVPPLTVDGDSEDNADSSGEGRKAAERVWEGISGDRANDGGGRVYEEAGLREVTLEAFLARAGAVAEVDVGAAPAVIQQQVDAPVLGFVVDPALGDRSVHQQQQLLQVDGLHARSGNGVEGGKKRTLEEPLDKASQQKQRRMIKNRESAARSRERKQAYTSDLEKSVAKLEEEKARLVKQQEEQNKARLKQLMENLIPVDEKKKRPPRRLRRTCSVDW